MTTATHRPPPPPVRGAAPAPAPTVARAARVIAPREIKPVTLKVVLNAVEGFGKTTFGAHAPDPIILMSRGETGYDTLLSAGRVPQVPAYVVETWEDTLGWCDDLIANPSGRKTLVFDATGGFERMCHEFVCRTQYGNDWGDKGFMSFQKGYESSVPEWLKLLAKLERLKDEHGMTIVLLGHTKVAGFKNPLGADFDRYTSDVHAKTWAVTAKWVDAVLFGNFYTIVDKEKQGKGKGVGGTDRVIYTERRDGFDAKNRLGMPPEIWLTDVAPSQTWQTVWDAMTNKPTAG